MFPPQVVETQQLLVTRCVGLTMDSVFMVDLHHSLLAELNDLINSGVQSSRTLVVQVEPDIGNLGSLVANLSRQLPAGTQLTIILQVRCLFSC